MKKVMLGLVGIGCVVWMGAGLGATPKEANPPRVALGTEAMGAGGQSPLLAFATTVADKYQQVTLIDPKQRAMSVYHIDLADGKIHLRSVRNFHWDLQLIHLNGQPPLPREIQAILEQPSP
ncbi:MAG: hypothetical protein NZ602_06350 [Thermoguttaceae bacterium]|nr:hypothetical protein [Thermoguttaceae bacterium]MDW8037967.1 hypothetical protein [Thermoguttaceae bacterium]